MKCAYCDTEGLHWAKDALGKWRLHYQTGDLHTCRATREKIAKAIPKKPFWNEKALAKWEAEQPKPPPPPPPEALYDYNHAWWSWLDDNEPLNRRAELRTLTP